MIVYRNGVAAERRRGVDRHRGILFQNFIGVGKLCTGEGLVCRRARAGLSFEIQTGERRLAIKLQGELFVLRIASVLHADAEDHRIAACAAQERLCQLLVFCACRNGLADGFPSGIPVICRDACVGRLSGGTQAEIRIDVAAEGVRHGGAPRIAVLGRGQGKAFFVKFVVVVAGFGERERSSVDPLLGRKRGKVFELLVFALNGQLAADRAVAVSDGEGICAVRQAQRSVRFGFKLLFVAAFRRDRAAGKASAKRHGIQCVLRGFILRDCRLNGLRVSFRVLVRHAAVVLARRVIRVLRGQAHVLRFLQILHHLLHQKLPALADAVRVLIFRDADEAASFRLVEKSERGGCGQNGIALCHTVDGGQEAVACELERDARRFQRVADALTCGKRNLSRRDQQFFFRFGGEIEEAFSVCGKNRRHFLFCGLFIRRFFCRYFFFQRFFLWELFRVRVFFGRSVHDLFCFGDRRIVRRHAYRQAGQEHRQQKQHRNQAFHKIPPVQI